MKFDLDRSIEILSATPGVLRAMLGGLSEEWTASSGKQDEWQPYDVVGHLIHGDVTDWISRARIILEQGDNPTFEPFDRLAQFERSKGKSLGELLDEFERRRAENIVLLRGWGLSAEDLDLEGMHPELGRTTLRQLIATWVVHDLNHIKQIAVAMARRYDAEVGPWKQYLGILQ